MLDEGERDMERGVERGRERGRKGVNDREREERDVR